MRRQLLKLTGALFLAGLVGSAVSVRADTPAILGQFTLTAVAPGAQVTYDFPTAPTHPLVAGQASESYAGLAAGPIGYALSATAWPGSLLGNAGDTASLLNLPLPDGVAKKLNDPVRAEARTGSGPSSVTNTSYPGAVMAATARGDHVAAETTTAAGNPGTPQFSVGDSITSAETTRSSGAAVAASKATFRNIDIGGVLEIKSVQTTASTTTDGKRATGSSSMLVSGATVAGTAVVIDDNGLHAGPVNGPATTTLNEAANKALAKAGITVYVGQPTRRVGGARATYTSGCVVILIAPPGDANADSFTITLGAVSASVAAGLELAVPQGSATPNTQGTASQPSFSAPRSITSVPSSVTSTSTLPTGVAPSVSTLMPAVKRLEAIRLPGGISALWPALAVLGALLIASRASSLPSLLLSAPRLPTCPNGGIR